MTTVEEESREREITTTHIVHDVMSWVGCSYRSWCWEWLGSVDVVHVHVRVVSAHGKLDEGIALLAHVQQGFHLLAALTAMCVSTE